MRALLCSALLVLVTSIVGCDLVFESQDVVFKHDVEGDALDVLLVYHGVSAGDAWRLSFGEERQKPERDERIEKGVVAFERVAAGGREGMIVDWPLYASLDTMKEKDEKKLANPDTGADDKADLTECLALYEFVKLVDHGAFVDDRDRLCGFQRMRVQPWSKFEAMANARISAEVRRVTQHPDDDAEGFALRLAKANANTPWFTFDRGVLKIDVPMSAAERAQGVREMATALAESGKDVPAGTTQHASWSSLVGEWVATARVLTFDERGLRAELGSTGAPLHWSIQCSERPYDSGLLDALKAKGVKVRDDVKVADLIAAMQ